MLVLRFFADDYGGDTFFQNVVWLSPGYKEEYIPVNRAHQYPFRFTDKIFRLMDNLHMNSLS
jgi:hypothetical protein